MLTVAFNLELGAFHTDCYQRLESMNQLLNVNDNIINRQYRTERQFTKSDVVDTKDNCVFAIFNGWYHKFDKGTDEICDKSNNLGFLLGYEKSCNENLTLGTFAGYINTYYKQDGTCHYVTNDGVSGFGNIMQNDGNVCGIIFGVFSHFMKDSLLVSGVLSGSRSDYDPNESCGGDPLVSNRKGYSVGGTVNVCYDFVRKALLLARWLQYHIFILSKMDICLNVAAGVFTL